MAHEFWPELERAVLEGQGREPGPCPGYEIHDRTAELLLDLHHRLCASEAAVAALQEAVGALAEAVTLLSGGGETKP